jgi:hypothetical protein
MPSIDIEVSASVQDALDLPTCEAIGIPMPKPVSIQLPTGASLKAFTDLSKGIPNDCAMSFNLLLQVAPLLAAIECPLRVLKLLKPLVDVVTGLAKVPPEPPSPEKIGEVLEAAAELAPCFLVPTPANLLPFVKDILCLIRKVLKCLVDELSSIRDLLGGLQLRFAAAEGNDDLLATLECAQENANASLQNATQAVEPIAALLALLSPITGMAGLPELNLPVPGATPESVEQISALVDTLQAVIDAIDEITGGTCD